MTLPVADLQSRVSIEIGSGARPAQFIVVGFLKATAEGSPADEGEEVDCLAGADTCSMQLNDSRVVAQVNFSAEPEILVVHLGYLQADKVNGARLSTGSWGVREEQAVER